MIILMEKIKKQKKVSNSRINLTLEGLVFLYKILITSIVFTIFNNYNKTFDKYSFNKYCYR